MALLRRHAIVSHVQRGVHTAARAAGAVVRGVDRGMQAVGKLDRVMSAVKPVYEKAVHPALHASGYGDLANSIKGGLSTYEQIRRSIR